MYHAEMDMLSKHNMPSQAKKEQICKVVREKYCLCQNASPESVQFKSQPTSGYRARLIPHP